MLNVILDKELVGELDAAGVENAAPRLKDEPLVGGERRVLALKKRKRVGVPDNRRRRRRLGKFVRVSLGGKSGWRQDQRPG